MSRRDLRKSATKWLHIGFVLAYHATKRLHFHERPHRKTHSVEGSHRRLEAFERNEGGWAEQMKNIESYVASKP